MANRKPTSAKHLDPSQSPRAMYGAELRFQRERAGLSQAALGERLFAGYSLIATMESPANAVSSRSSPNCSTASWTRAASSSATSRRAARRPTAKTSPMPRSWRPLP